MCVCARVQLGQGTESCVCRSWASTTWRFCQLSCLMTLCTSARPPTLPWGPGGPNSPSSVCPHPTSHILRRLADCGAPSLPDAPLFFSHPVPPDDPVIDGGPEVLLNAGESYNLSCVSRGAKPPSVIEWLKDGLPVEGANSITVRQLKNTHWRLYSF